MASTSKKFDVFKKTLDKVTETKNKATERVKIALNTPTITEFRKFYGQHETQVNRTVNFSKETVRAAHSILNSDKTNMFSYITLATGIKESYTKWFATSFSSRFATEWTTVAAYGIYSKALNDELDEKYNLQIVKSEDNKRCLIFPEFVLYWGYVGDAFVANTAGADAAKKFLYDLFWGYFFEAVSFSYIKDELTFERMPKTGFVQSKKADETSLYLDKFIQKKISRSVLFYGPPGTGKSNIVKNIANKLGQKTLNLNFADLSRISTSFIHSFLETMRPDIIILEDIDHTKIENSSNVLAIIETINKSGKLLLATTNEVSSLNDAIIRPGRFDELIEIDKFDDEVLLQIIGGDKELFAIVKDFPIASTMELMKRIEALGRVDALKTVGDIQQRCKNMKDRYNCKLEGNEKDKAKTTESAVANSISGSSSGLLAPTS